MEIGNSPCKTAFCGVIKNSIWSRVKKYAIENGKKEELKAFEDFCNKHKNCDFAISGRHVKRPCEGNHIVVKVNSPDNTKKRGYELFYMGTRDITENVYNIMKKIFDPTSELYQKTFR